MTQWRDLLHAVTTLFSKVADVILHINQRTKHKCTLKVSSKQFKHFIMHFQALIAVIPCI